MQTPHYGRAFELLFRCERLLPELAAAGRVQPDEPVIDIVWNAEAQTDSAPEANADRLFKPTPEGARLDVPGVASFDISAARITVRPEAGIDDSSVRAFLFGSAIGALLHLRTTLVLHGSAVQLPDGTAAVFCGMSTAGKSTLAAALAQRGHLLLADDLAAVRIDEAGQAWCLPGLARSKLWSDALDTLGMSGLAHPLAKVRPHLEKYSTRLPSAAAPAPLHRFYELRAQPHGSVTFAPIGGLERINSLMTHTYRPTFLAAMGRQPEHLRRVAALAPRLKMSLIARPREVPTLPAIIDWLEREWAC